MAIVWRLGHRHGGPWAMVDNPQRDASPVTHRILELVGAAPGMRIADIGSGGGYLTMKLAYAVGPTGHVTATDVDPHMLEIVRWEAWRRGLPWVSTSKVRSGQTGIEPASYDRIVMVNVYPFLVCREAEGTALLRQFVEALHPTGKLIIHHGFIHTASWKPTHGPSNPCDQPSAETLAEWAASFARVELIENSGWKRSETPPGTKPGYRIVLTPHPSAPTA